MDGTEYLRLCKAAKIRYKNELIRLSNDFINSNVLFRIGDTVEVKNVFLSGRYIVDKIYMESDDDFDAVKSPSCYIHSIKVIGRKISDDGRPSAFSNHFNATDVVKGL